MKIRKILGDSLGLMARLVEDVTMGLATRGHLEDVERFFEGKNTDVSSYFSFFLVCGVWKGKMYLEMRGIARWMASAMNTTHDFRDGTASM